MSEKLLVEFSGRKNLHKYARMLLSGNNLPQLTRFALTAPNPIWAAAYPSFPVLAQNNGIPYVDIKGDNDLLLLKKAIANGSIEAETVVIDRLDEIQRRMFLNRMITEKRDVLKNEDWNWMEVRLNQIAKGFSDLEVNLIFITAPKDVGGFDGQDFVTKPDIQGGFSSDIYSYVDYAAWMEDALAPEVIIDHGGEELDFPSLRLKATTRYPWVFDATGTLRTHFRLHSEDDFGRIIELRKEIPVEDSPDPREIVFEELTDPEDKDDSVPGMSKADKLNKILKTKKANKGE